MIEIIPNWHPIFVHFTIALLSIAGIGFILAYINIGGRFKADILKVAQWNFIIGSAITILTLLAGWYAYNTVAHDTASHAAMTDHRNWALATVGLMVLINAWLWRNRNKKAQRPSIPFVITIVLFMALLSSTAWRGGEVVYRYGLGVMSLPVSEGDGHDHQHAPGEEHDSIDSGKDTQVKKESKPAQHDHSDHKH